VREARSPDGRWFLGFKDHNLSLRSAADGREVPLTADGVEGYEWDVTYPQTSSERGIEWVWWSPDSSRVAVKKSDYRRVPKVPIVHYLEAEEQVTWGRPHWTNHPRSRAELYFVDIASRRQVRIDTGHDPGQSRFTVVGWRPEGTELLFLRLHSTFKQLDLLAANPVTGATRVILTEMQKTFTQAGGCILLEDGMRFLWRSERDGWNHLYLYRVDGTLVRRLTAGKFPIREVVAVDEPGGWVYFTAHDDRKRPYDTHLCRVNLEGQRFTRLTAAIGQHDIQFAPSKAFFLDTHSTIARPPMVELRRADGKRLQTLSIASTEALKELKWSPPEEFVVKAADGKTDLHGVLFKPYDFDPNKKYPVIDCIFGAPWRTMVPRTFSAGNDAEALAQLGYITFIVDVRGSPERGKAFHDFVYGNIGRHEIPDNVATLKQLGESRSSMDLSRVGVMGYSWGGYTALRAMLLAPENFAVGIATEFFARAPMDSNHSYARYMGPREENEAGHEYASNLPLVGNLKGKLLLIYGTSSHSTSSSTAETMKLVQALIQAGKFFDVLPLPEQGHGIAGTSAKYRQAVIRRYFQEHLKP
jgi:dipeptidyl aminopeptidase/acylaminoacyl peptidase